MAQGSVTQSFLTIFSVKHKYSLDDFTCQSLYRDFSGSPPKSLSIYKSLSCFVSIASDDSRKFEEFGQCLCEALGETGSKEYSAIDKILNIFMISKGSRLPLYQSSSEGFDRKKKKNGNSYQRLF